MTATEPALHELLGWWEATRRDLPWRRTRDPWAVLVSEVMLQQTQVDRVVPRWHRFLERFPTTEACVAAGVGAVVEEWAGLGYNRRAVALHSCATAVEERHGGVFPADLAELLALPGIGPYTARAVLAFAFERDVAVVDTNVGRILARTAGRPLAAREAQARADELVPAGEGWAWNQAMLDLGATVCRKRSPSCDACPVRASCSWAVADRPDPDPAVGSHAVSRPQSRFDGSFRQGRARLLDALRAGAVLAPADWPAACGWPPADGSPTNGAPTTTAPTNGGPTNGGPTNGGPTNGGPTNGGPTNGGSTNGTPTSDDPTNAVPADGFGPADAVRAAESLVADGLAVLTPAGHLALPR